jgi:cytochrome b561
MNQTTLIKYNAVARMLHWLIGLAIIFALVLGLGHDGWKDILWIMPVHKATGMTILALSLARLGWRLAHPAPPLPATMPNWQISFAHGLHWLFYFMMIAVPLTGWIFSSAGKYPLEWFGLFDIPKLPVVKDSALAEAAHEGHEVMGLLFIPLLALHIGAAFYHHFVVRDDVLRRML